MTYKIKPEYFHLWGDEANEETTLDEDQIEMIARGWEKPVEEIIDQLIPDYFDSAVSFMDDEIREAVHADLAPCTEARFLWEYAKRHQQKYGEPFAI